MKSALRVLSALLVCIGVVVTAASAGMGQTPTAPPPVERVAQQLAPPERNPPVKSVIVFVLDGGQEYSATAGATFPAPDQRFRIGSVTKTFTATIVLQLIEEGRLRLNETLDDYLPGVVPRGDEITVRHLLSHRSGLVNVTKYPWLNRAERSSSTRPIRTLRFAASHPLDFPPGSTFQYSNTNYIALGLVIEKVTGHSYARELEERILEPLELDHTELPKTRRLPDLDDAGYNPNLPWAAGAIVSNARDLARFFSALLSGQVVSRASLAKMKRQVGGQFSPGLGIFALRLPCGRTWGHTGGILDYGTFVSASENGDRVAVISHRLPGPPPTPPDISALLCAPSSARRDSTHRSGARGSEAVRGRLTIRHDDRDGLAVTMR